MKKIVISLCMMVSFLCITGVSQASTILNDWAFKVNDNVYPKTNNDNSINTQLPSGFAGSFDLTTGLGTISWNTSAQGTYNVGAFLDIEIDETDNTFHNEYGFIFNQSKPSNLSWEIDEPGYETGNIYNNFTGSGLENTIGSLVSGQDNDSFDDVSFALAWNFTIGQNEKATIHWTTTLDVPNSVFYLAQVDPDSDNKTIYFYSTLDIENTGTGGTDPIPEPGTMIFFGMGLLGLSRLGRKKI